MATSVCHSQKTDEHPTPQWIVDDLARRFCPGGRFDLDPCCQHGTNKAPRYYTPEENGLVQPWGGNVWCNPPYSDARKWVQKAVEERFRCRVIVMLLPVRTSSGWFYKLVERYANKILFVRGRLRFEGSGHDAPFASMVVIFDQDATGTVWRSIEINNNYNLFKE